MAEQYELDAAFDGIFDEGEEEQEIAVPAEEESNVTEVTDDNANDGDDSDVGQQEVTDPVEQTADENAKFAAARRKAEANAAHEIEKIREEARQNLAQQIDAAIADMGLENPYTGQPITTKAEMDAYRAQHAKELQKAATEKMDDMGLTAEERRALLASDPEYQEAMKLKAEVESLRQKTNEIEQQRKLERAEKRMADGIAAINKEDPSINSMGDLLKHPKFKEINAMVGVGATLEQAYKAVCVDDIIARRAGEASAQARQNYAGKSHLGSKTPRGDGGITVPASVMAEYRRILPDASDEQIMKHYAKEQRVKK